MLMNAVEKADGELTGRILKQAVHTVGLRGVTFLCRISLIYLLGHVFQPADYGAYSLISTVTTFGVFLVGLNLYTYVYRSVPGQPHGEQLKILRTTLTTEVLVASALVAAFLLSGLLPPVLVQFRTVDYQNEFSLGMLMLIALVASAEVGQYLTARAEIERSNWMDFLNQAAWIVPLLGLWLLGGDVTLGVVLAANLVGILAATAYGFRHVGFRAWWQARPDWMTLRTAMAFSAPMIVPALSFYALKMGDRFFLSYFRSLDEVGLYSFAYTFLNTLYSFTAWVVFNAFGPYVFAAHNRGDHAQRDSLQTYMVKTATTVFLIGVGFLLALAQQIVSLLARPEYAGAIGVMPWLALGYLIIIVTYPAHYLLTLQNRVLAIMLIDLAGMIVGLSGDLILIPRFSYYGAAGATIAGLGLVMILKYGLSHIWGSFDSSALFSLKVEANLVRQYVNRSHQKM